jgi:hypothetical protein
VPPLTPAAARMATRPLALATLRPVPSPCRWGEHRLVRERSSAPRTQEACPLALVLVPGADAQGRRDSAAASRGPRLALTSTALHQARQARRRRGGGASHHPRSQVVARDAGRSEAPTRPSTVAADDDPLDLQAVFARLGGVWV